MNGVCRYAAYNLILLLGLSKRVVPFLVIKSSNSLGAEFIAGGISHGSVLLKVSCAFCIN